MTGCPSGNALLLCYTGASWPLNSLWHVVGKHKTLPFTVEVWHHCRLIYVHLAYAALSRHHRADPTYFGPGETKEINLHSGHCEKKSRPVSTAVADPPLPLRCNIAPMTTCPVAMRKFGSFFRRPTALLLANNVTAEGHRGNEFKLVSKAGRLFFRSHRTRVRARSPPEASKRCLRGVWCACCVWCAVCGVWCVVWCVWCSGMWCVVYGM